MRTMTAYRKNGQKIVFDTPHSDEVAKSLIGKIQTTFAQSLARTKYPTPPQLAWLHKLVVDNETPRPDPITLGGSLIELFDKTNGKIKYPKISFRTLGGPLKLQRSGSRSKYEGQINITDGRPYGVGEWYGRIDREGNWNPSTSCPPKVVEFLTEFAKNPAGVGGAYGRDGGHCVFCQLELTTPRSVGKGYGPTCAKNWDLPY